MFDKMAKVAGIFSETLRDALLFLRFNSYSPFVDKSRRAFYKIIIEAHTIEKGLSLSDPKLLFGKDKMATFEGHFVAEKDVRHEHKNPYFEFIHDAGFVRALGERRRRRVPDVVEAVAALRAGERDLEAAAEGVAGWDAYGDGHGLGQALSILPTRRRLFPRR